MKNNLRALFGVSALALALTAGPVLAAQVDVTAVNHKTGADSDNDNTYTVNENGDMDLTNVGDVTNAASVDANTGGNEQEENTSIGHGDPTGSISGATDWENVVNEGANLCDCLDNSDWDVTADFVNDTTGADSDNDNKLTVNNGGDVTLVNLANVVNSLAVNANTGDNEQEKNTAITDGITTGDVTVDSMISNWANSGNNSGHGSMGNNSVDVTMENHLTGYKSDNDNKVTVNNGGNHTVVNSANLVNAIAVNANTGGNEQEKNTKVGDITTGDVNVSTDIQNVANNNDCGCLMGGHKSTDVKVDATNDTTGANSDNNNKVTVNNGGNTTVTNSANVTNSVAVTANTGDNEQEKNTSVENGITTGNVNFDFSAVNSVNSSN